MRPQFHFTARTGWINDPHGITVKDGEYHVFYQYVPGSTVWAPNCHWGHATGPDLFSLTEGPIAIAPGDGDDGIWTGSLVQDSGKARIFYTSTRNPDFGIGRVRVATPVDDDWNAWEKEGFVADAPPELDLVAYRDPFLVKEPDGWRMFLAGGLADGTAAALSYTSSDLESWQYEGIALQRSTHEREPAWMGALWECPQIFEVDGRHVMVSSVWENDVLHHAGYAVGSYADGHFEAEAWGQLTFGPSYYAPSFFRDAEGRPCLTFWMRGVSDVHAGWASAHSVPHVLSLDGDVLVARPHPDLDRYRGKPVTDGTLPTLAGDVEWTPDDGGELTVSSDNSILFVLARVSKGLQVSTAAGTWTMPYSGGPVRVLLDAQAVEISAGLGVMGFDVKPTGAGFAVVGDGEPIVRPLLR